MLHGGDIYGVLQQRGQKEKNWIDFSANINPMGMPESLKRAMEESIEFIRHYPDPLCRELAHKISIAEGVREYEILCGNGAADLIFRLVYALKPKRVLLVAPTFLEYEEALKQVDAHIDYYFLNDKLEIEPGIVEHIKKDTDMVFICNPNNPTGILTGVELLESILKKAKEVNSYLIMDECFLDFVSKKEDYSLLSYIEEHDNLFLLKSFTKMYGIPGLRLGYMIHNNVALLEKIRQAGQTWSVNTIAQRVGIAALMEEGFVEKTVTYVTKEREYLIQELEAMGLTVYRGHANYLLFYRDNLEELYERLLERGIIIRRCSNYMGLTKNHYRIAVRKHTENKYLIRTLKDMI